MRTNFSLISLQFIRFNFKAFRLMNRVIIDNYTATRKDKICILEVFTSSKKLPLSFRNTRGKRTENKTFSTSLSGISYNRLTPQTPLLLACLKRKLYFVQVRQNFLILLVNWELHRGRNHLPLNHLVTHHDFGKLPHLKTRQAKERLVSFVSIIITSLGRLHTS